MKLHFVCGALLAATVALSGAAAIAQPVTVQVHGPGWGLRVGPPPRPHYPPRPPVYVVPPPYNGYGYGGYGVPGWWPVPVYGPPPVVIVRPWAPPPRWHRHPGYRGG
jgi:hypothetical protein